MSWQVFVDNLTGTGKVKQASICGDDGYVLAQSTGLTIKPEEVRNLVDRFSNPNEQFPSHFSVSGVEYNTTRSDAMIILGRQDTKGIAIARTGKCLIIGTAEGEQQRIDCETEVNKLSKLLLHTGF